MPTTRVCLDQTPTLRQAVALRNKKSVSCQNSSAEKAGNLSYTGSVIVVAVDRRHHRTAATTAYIDRFPAWHLQGVYEGVLARRQAGFSIAIAFPQHARRRCRNQNPQCASFCHELRGRTTSTTTDHMAMGRTILDAMFQVRALDSRFKTLIVCTCPENCRRQA